jgi:dihydropteridine reductase
MAGYGISKGATHQLVKSMGVPGALNDRACGVGVLPITIDTPANRDAMPDADFSSWTSPEDMAMKIFEWQMAPHLRPLPGPLMNVVTTGNVSEWAEASRLRIIMLNHQPCLLFCT